MLKGNLTSLTPKRTMSTIKFIATFYIIYRYRQLFLTMCIYREILGSQIKLLIILYIFIAMYLNGHMHAKKKLGVEFM